MEDRQFFWCVKLFLPETTNSENILVYNTLITTVLRYTPVVLEHHIPYKTLPDGKL